MFHPRRSRLLATLLAFLFVASACGGSTVASSSGTDAAAPPPATLLEGEFQTVSGATIDLGSLEGQDTVLWFWAPW